MLENKWMRRLAKGFMIVLAVAAILKVYYELKLLDLLLGIYKLEGEKKRIARVSFKSLMYIARKSNGDDALIDEMDRIGWNFYNAYGNGYVFSKHGEEILLKKREYPRYVVYEVTNPDYFNVVTLDEEHF